MLRAARKQDPGINSPSLRENGHPLPNRLRSGFLSERSAGVHLPCEAIEQYGTWSLDTDGFRVWNVREFGNILRSSLEYLIRMSKETPARRSGRTHRYSLELFELLLDRFFIIKGQIVGEHVANFLPTPFNLR